MLVVANPPPLPTKKNVFWWVPVLLCKVGWFQFPLHLFIIYLSLKGTLTWINQWLIFEATSLFIRLPTLSCSQYTQIPLNSCLFFLGGEVSEPTPVRVNFIWLMIENLGDQCYWAYMNFYIQLPLGFSKHQEPLKVDYYSLILWSSGKPIFTKAVKIGTIESTIDIMCWAYSRNLLWGFLHVAPHWSTVSEKVSTSIRVFRLVTIEKENHFPNLLFLEFTRGWNFETWKPLGVETLKLENHWGLRLWSVSPPRTIN